MSIRVVLVKTAGEANTTYVSYTPRENWGSAVLMKRSFRKLVFTALGLVILLSLLGGQRYLDKYFHNSKYFDGSRKPKKEKTPKLIIDATTERHSIPTVSKYAEFFKDKNVTKDGIFPLQEKHKMHPIRPRNSDIPTRFYDENNTNYSPHEYSYILNPHEFCTNVDEVFLLVMIASASWEFNRRELIRRTWASQKGHDGEEIKYIFFVGNDHRPTNQQKLQEEFNLFGDLVEEDFDETYKNLTLKTIGQLKWVTYFCPNAKYGLHIDDDVFGQINEISTYLQETSPTRFMGCSKVFHPIVRRDGKWTMTKEDYPGDQYPLGCVGWCFAMSADVMADLYWMSIDTPLIHLEDVTTTGILREKIGVTSVKKMPGDEQWCQHKGWPKDRSVEEKLEESWQQYTNEKAL